MTRSRAIGIAVAALALFFIVVTVSRLSRNGDPEPVTLPPVTITETVAETETVTESAEVTDTLSDTETETTTTFEEASEESVSLHILNAEAERDPVEDVGRVFEFTVQSTSDKYLWVTYRGTGGASCAPTYSGDSGDELISTEIPSGLQTVREPITWQNPGRYLFCMWLGSSSDDPDSRVFSMVVSFRQPRGSVSFSARPPRPQVNGATVLRFHGSSEAPRYVFVTERSAGGAPCAPTYSSDSGSHIIGENVDGGFAVRYVRTFDSPGTYMYCVWLAEDSDDTAPIVIKRFTLRVG